MSARDSQGTWTMIYDEGFEVNVAGLNFFAFSNFTFKKNEKNPNAPKHNVSHCGDTMVGWYQNRDRTKFGCYYAAKVLPSRAAPRPVTVTPHPAHTEAKKSANYDIPLSNKTQ